ncbi:MAG: DHH family phosphoesterase [Clostridia bacterium]|nr:DHH family phosphoesterase [Clostridia bacterium]
MFKKLWNFNALYITLLCFAAVQTVAFYFTNKTLFYISLGLFVVLAIITFVRIFSVNKRVRDLIRSINDDLDNTASNSLTAFNLPVLIVSDENEIIWFNSRFTEKVNADADLLVGKNIAEVIGDTSVAELSDKHITTACYNNKIFDVYETTHKTMSTTQRILCFVDLTKLRKTASEYKLSRPVVAFIAIDNLDDLTHNMRDSERNNVSSKIQTVLEDWFSTSNGISRKISGERYLFMFEERDLILFTSTKFDILQKVRSIDFGDRGKATISIGIGCGYNYRECEEQATQALDMALGRGGDQVAIKKRDNTFQFFGGISGANEKRTRVRTRVVASALLELINNSDRVILMGHKFADLDCFGAAYALCSAIKTHTGTPATIAINKQTTLSAPLFQRITSLGADLMISDYASLTGTITSKTLLIVIDTHRPSMLEYPALLNEVGTVAVIDHHRKSVDHIANAVIFYHETSASSASEMVCELLQYISEKSVGKPQAEAMLAGIVLDSRNFCMNTGVRTFEASAFLRKKGADPVAVKKMFADSLDHHKIKNAVIATAEQYKNYAIAVNDASGDDDERVRIISSQAADEMLNISGVKASFVIFAIDEQIIISARSYGDINVQLIMEKLGGGGHRTMAACQLDNTDIDTAKNMLLNAIKYHEEEV